MKTVPLGGGLGAGQLAQVDDAKYLLVASYSWHALPGSSRSHTLYAAHTQPRGVRPRMLLMHHLILPGVARIDHWDGNGLNNQEYNLRAATPSQNGGNAGKHAPAKSRFKGVRLCNGAWQAEIMVNRKRYYLGSFAQDEIAAARAYNLAASEAWGPYARLNDVPEEVMTNAGKPTEHIPRVGRKDAHPGRDVPRPQLAPSDAMLTATGPLTMPGPGEQWGRPQDDGRPVLHGAGDAVMGAPLSPPPAGAVSSSMSLGVDSAGGYAVPKQLDGPAKPRKHRRP